MVNIFHSRMILLFTVKHSNPSLNNHYIKAVFFLPGYNIEFISYLNLYGYLHNTKRCRMTKLNRLNLIKDYL